ncbi:MAG: hypothetical protein ABI137_08535 [Antricoccus sp.]
MTTGSRQLQAMIIALRTPDLSASSDELIDQISALETMRAVTAAAQAQLMVAFLDQELYAESAGDGLAHSLPARRRSAIAQIALARRISPQQQSNEMAFASLLCTDLAITLSALQRGAITEYAAKKVASELVVLDVHDRRAVDRDLAALLDGMSAKQAASAAHHRVAAIDARAIITRMERAAASRRVSVRPAPDGMAYFTILTDLSSAVSMYAALHKAAGSPSTDPGPRSHGAIMADTAFQRVTGYKSSAHVPLEIGLVITDQTLLADGRAAGRIGQHVVPAEIARHLITRGAASKTKQLVRRLYADPATGTLTRIDGRARTFNGKLRRFITARDQICRTPYCEAPIRDIDHANPWAHDGPTNPTNGNGRCQRCNLTKESPGWKSTSISATPGKAHRIVITTPTGHEYISNAPPLLEYSRS